MVRADLAAGRLTTAEAGGAVYLLSLDQADLGQQLAQAEAATTAAQAVLQATTAGLALARENWVKAEAQAQAELLAIEVTAMEQQLNAAIGRLHQLGLKAGKSNRLGDSWRPTPELVSRMRQIAVPGEFWPRQTEP